MIGHIYNICTQKTETIGTVASVGFLLQVDHTGANLL